MREIEKISQIYDEILSPIQIEPVRKRDWGPVLTIGLTLAYPIFVPLVFLKTTLRPSKPRFIDGYYHIWALTIPCYLPSAIKELISPSIKGVRISNPEVFLSEPAEDRAAITYNKYLDFNPEFFGYPSINGRKAFLEALFPDGLVLKENSAYYSEFGKETYSQSRYFLPFDINLRKKLDLVCRVEQED